MGNSIGGTEFRDKSGNDADGNAVHMYNYIISFLTRNLRHKQVEKDFNSPGELEVSMTSLSEIVANGILHRSYVIEAPLRVFIFDNRIEIHSPVYVRWQVLDKCQVTGPWHNGHVTPFDTQSPW